MKKKLIVLSGFVSSLVPVVALAAVNTNVTCVAGQIDNIESVLCKVNELLSAVVPVLIALAVVYFVWGVVSYMFGGDEEAKKNGRGRIIYGIIGLAVIVSLWGLVNILTNTFGLTGSNYDTIILPTVDF